MIADEVHELEVSRVNGMYVDIDGSVMPNQVFIQREIELGHELINECLHHYDPEQIKKAQRDDKELSEIMDRIYDARQTLQWSVEEDTSSNLLDVNELLAPVTRGLEYLEAKAGSALGAASYLLSNLIQSTLGFASKLIEKLETIDPKLEPLYNQVL